MHILATNQRHTVDNAKFQSPVLAKEVLLAISVCTFGVPGVGLCPKFRGKLKVFSGKNNGVVKALCFISPAKSNFPNTGGYLGG